MLPTYTSDAGKTGENFACEHLKKQGYTILARNWRKKYGEIDIVAKAPGGTLVFVEVKYLRVVGDGGLMPEDQLTFDKSKKLKKTCQAFANSHPELVLRKGWRIDLLAILPFDNKAYLFKHFSILLR